MKLLILLVVAFVTLLIFARLKATRRPEAATSSASFSIPPPDPDVLMLRGFDFYVRLEASRSQQMVERLRVSVGARGVIYPRAEWAVVLWDDFRIPEAVLGQLSRDLQTEVIWLSFQKQVDAFEYARWTSGQLRRRLTFGCYEKERTWEHVEGTPEEWEAGALFDPKYLGFELDRIKRYPPEDTSPADAEKELRAIWREQRLTVDGVMPNINGRDAAEAVAAAYGLPGWQ